MPKRIVALVASLAAALAGGWLILAPFALGYRPPGAPWNHPTEVDVWTGVGVVVVALVALAACLAGMQGELTARGVIRPRASRAERRALRAAASAGASPAADPPTGPSPSPAELRDLLAPLVQALLSDLGTAERDQGPVAGDNHQVLPEPPADPSRPTTRRYP